jgi:hypothetical protein
VANDLDVRFDAGRHDYIEQETGEVLPGITQLLKQAGRIDDRWFDDDAAERGTWVHARTADYDLGLISRPEGVTHGWKPYLLAHVACMRALQPDILHVEELSSHPTHRYCSRIDRVLNLHRVRGVWEIKTGGKAPWHPVQTALEAILDSVESGIPPQHTRRWCCYLRFDGGYKVERHDDPRDLAEAYEVLRVCGRY